MCAEDRIYPSLFTQTYGTDKRHLVMQTVDELNEIYGREKVFFASSGIKHKWQMRREMVTPRYTTRWDELLQV
jgi:DNA polymerase V